MRFPIEYRVELEKTDVPPLVLRAPHRPQIGAGPPPEFGGSDQWWSPEHLLVAATASCFVATFESMARVSDLPIGALRCQAKGILGRLADGVSFTSIELLLDLRVVPDDVERAKKMVQDARSRCFVARSLSCTVDVVAEVHAS